MKKYVIMGYMLGIGGWQLYCEARIIYLQELGYDVYFINCGDVDISRVKLDTYYNVKHIVLGPGISSPYVYSRKQIRAIICSVLSQMEFIPDDKVFVESTCIWQALWGELIAKYTNGIHFAYLLHSHFERISLSTKRFFLFKYHQGLLGGMTNSTVPELLSGLIEVPSEKANGMSAAMKDALVESDSLDYVIKDIRKNNGGDCCIIGYFGTLNKPHFALVCDEVAQFVLNHPEKSFCFLSVGSSANGSAEAYQMSFMKKSSNFSTCNIPELFPVPKSVFQSMNVCIASWGSSWVAARGGAKTIRLVDDVSTRVAGVIGVTLHDAGQMNVDSGRSLSQWMDDCLFDGEYARCKSDPLINSRPDFRIIHRKNDSIIQPFVARDRCHEYYPTENVTSGGSYQRTNRLLFHIFGPKVTLKVKRFVLKLIKKAKQMFSIWVRCPR